MIQYEKWDQETEKHWQKWHMKSLVELDMVLVSSVPTSMFWRIITLSGAPSNRTLLSLE